MVNKERFKLIPSVYALFIQDEKILLSRRFQTGYEDGKYSLVAGHADGEARSGEGLAPDHFLRQAQLGADQPHLVLEEEAQRLGVADRVRFLGWLDRDDVARCYADATVVAVPSLWPEPFGRIAIEAQAAGKMVIGSDIGGIKETMADGGFLVAPGNIIALQQQLNSQLDHQPLMRIPDKSTYRRQIIAKKLNQLYQT